MAVPNPTLHTVASGQCSTTIEKFMAAASHRLGMPTACINVSHRGLQVSFGTYPPHMVHAGRDLVLSTLSDLSALSDAISDGDVISAATALHVCDQILAYVAKGYNASGLCGRCCAPSHLRRATPRTASTTVLTARAQLTGSHRARPIAGGRCLTGG